MKKLLAAALLIPFAVARAADEKPPTPGFWERAWESTKKGTGRVVGVAKAPLRKFDPANADASAGLRDLAATLTLEPRVVRFPDTRVLEITFVVTNKGRRAVELQFPTSQRIEVLVKNEAGKVLSRWSDDQPVEKEPGFLLVNPGERLEYEAKISTREMAPGQSFQIEVFLPSYESIRASKTVAPVR